MTIKKAGAVVDARLIKGTVVVEADNVTIKQSKIVSTGRYAVEVKSGVQGLVIEDTEIDGNEVATISILRGGFTLRRVDMHSMHDGPRIEADNVLIEDSYLHDLHRVPDGHHDIIQIRAGSNITIRGNYLDAYRDETGDPMNAAIQIGSMLSPSHDLVVENNLMSGGNFTVNAGGDGVQSGIFRNNVFEKNARYGAVQGLGGGIEWASSNVWLNTDTSVN